MIKLTQQVLHFHTKTSRDIPLRKTKNPYYIWLREVILQQTRIAQGLPYFVKFIKTFPTVFDLANASEETVLKLWQGLGYYSRAKNLHYTAKYIADKLNGEFPNNYKELLKLKGVGEYTAAAIASICFDEPKAAIDGNVYRVLSRYFGIETPINSTKGKKEFKELAKTLIDKEQPGAYNQAMMDFGAVHCKPQKPLCKQCNLNDNCIAFKKEKVSNLPVKLKKAKIKNRFFNYLFVVTKDKKTILTQRTKKGIWQGLYEFPLIETPNKINKQQLINSKEFKKLFVCKTEVYLFNSKDIVHKLSHQHLHTKFWVVNTSSIATELISIEQIYKLPVPVLIERFLTEFVG